MEKQRSLQRLRCCVQNYDWGKKGGDSEVGRLYACNSGSEIDPEKPYAEFWMGTHDSGPAFLIDQDLNMNTENGLSLRLKDWVSHNPNDVLGHKVVQKWGSDLPFLFKVLLINSIMHASIKSNRSLIEGVMSTWLFCNQVLSVAKALSIQAHPDQELAKALHKSMPNYYKDDNHKPEMALAITHFQALCGFITIEVSIYLIHPLRCPIYICFLLLSSSSCHISIA